jgi:hypothetical protein
VPTTITVSGLSCDHNIALSARSLDGTYHLQQGLINGKHHWKGPRCSCAPQGSHRCVCGGDGYLHIFADPLGLWTINDDVTDSLGYMADTTSFSADTPPSGTWHTALCDGWYFSATMSAGDEYHLAYEYLRSPPPPCPYTNDGECDETTGICVHGTDTNDCNSPPPPSCRWTDDGECDEPTGTGLCARGTDTNDCRSSIPPPPPPPPRPPPPPSSRRRSSYNPSPSPSYSSGSSYSSGYSSGSSYSSRRRSSSSHSSRESSWYLLGIGWFVIPGYYACCFNRKKERQPGET